MRPVTTRSSLTPNTAPLTLTLTPTLRFQLFLLLSLSLSLSLSPSLSLSLSANWNSMTSRRLEHGRIELGSAHWRRRAGDSLVFLQGAAPLV